MDEIFFPENAVCGDKRPHTMVPKLLEPKYFGYHDVVAHLNHGNKAVIMWTAGKKIHNTYGDEGDGRRSSVCFTDMRNNYLYYATQKDWATAGNKLPLR